MSVISQTPFQQFQSQRIFSKASAIVSNPAVFRASEPSESPLVASSPSTNALVDDFFHENHQLTANRIVGLFSAGLVMAFTGKWIWKGFFRNAKAGTSEPLHLETNNLLKNQSNRRNELNIALNFAESLSSIYRLAIFDPAQRPALMAYLGSGILGYLAGSVAQGSKEAWVRRQETVIRAQLINRMQDIFREGVRAKQNIDTQLKQRAEKEIYDMLVEAGVPNAHDLVSDMPIPQSLAIQRNYVHQPTHRTVRAMQFGAQDELLRLPSQDSKRRLLEAGILALGAGTGFAVQGFMKLFTGKKIATQFNGDAVVYQTLLIRDAEGWWLDSLKNPRKGLPILAGFMGMSAAAKLGKLFIDGLREIEVTRRNAQTEYLYQKHNRMKQDPSFHEIAETLAYEHARDNLRQNLSWLKFNPIELHRRIRVILDNIGLNSAPKYFPMTPIVNFTEARG